MGVLFFIFSNCMRQIVIPKRINDLSDFCALGGIIGIGLWGGGDSLGCGLRSSLSPPAPAWRSKFKCACVLAVLGN